MEVSRRMNIDHTQLFEMIPLGVLYLSIEGEVLSANSIAKRILDLPTEHLQRFNSFKSRYKTTKKGERDFFEDEFPVSLAIKTGKPILDVIMSVYNSKEDKHYWININAIPQFREGEDSPYQVCTFFCDITEQVRTGDALRASEERYKGLSEAAFESIFISEKGVCIEQNSVAEKMFGYTLEEAVGKMGTEWIVAEDHEKVMNKMLSGFEEPYEVTAQRKDGTVFPAEIQGKMMYYKGKSVRITALRDITLRTNMIKDLISAKEKAEESDRLKSVFLATMNHELRTPLNHVLGFSNIIQESSQDQEISDYAKIIHQSGSNLLELIEDIFKLATVEQGKFSLINQSLKCEDLYLDLQKCLKDELKQSGKSHLINLDFSTEEQLLKSWIYLDRGKIIQVMRHLFKNAVKFTDQGSIEFGFHRSNEKEIAFFVRDTGIGIPDDKQELIFDFFRQVDESYTRVYNGIGVGLAISKKIAEAMNGRITVESTLGAGSVFYFTIPKDSSNSNSIDQDDFDSI
ncbi:PAS domain S-box protein [Ancylomarina euxinus]|uniref:histidine kinase n=1 Tax=Ancylomarina euxinus TaxID=2283627 RepID=A0A425XZS9_9BACT|nr:ATP-binding protein [Ancylomarina euxinus]MCZ4695437.1 ATP-binding protein [Ancylomarina euxinus]MUP15633.1 PAS domain S-box protein [Ancylomarina euxinus]RRG20928.1 PAS domain S-box protein [Ancylomarina euxinus]